MTLIVETGAGLSTAESYCSVAAADARMTAHGNTTWATITTAEKEQALRRATAYMVQAYRSRWNGQRVKIDQALDWPRSWVEVDCFPINADVVPADISNACADLALKAAAGDLAPDVERLVIREKVGPIETEYSDNASPVTRYRAIDLILAPYLKGTSALSMLVRA